MTKFQKLPGQDLSEFNHGWRFKVMVCSAVLLLGLAACTIGVVL